jgi:type IV secretion system protein VirD4
MSKILKDTFVGLGKVGGYLAKGYLLKKEDGARFASKSKEADIFHRRNRGLIVDGINKRLSEDDSFEHIAIVAPPGKGKSTGYIRPNIYDKSTQNCSMVITDPSGELYDNTSQQLRDKGFEVLTLRPDDLSVSSKFNPFHGLDARDIIEIEQVCTSIILSKYGGDKEGIWNDGAISLLEVFAKCLAYSMPEYLNLPNINYLAQMFGADGGDLDDWVMDHSVNPYDSSDSSLVDSWMGIVSSNEKMLSSYSPSLKRRSSSSITERYRSCYRWIILIETFARSTL